MNLNPNEPVYLQINAAQATEINRLRAELLRFSQQKQRDQAKIRQLEQELNRFKPSFVTPRSTNMTRVMRNINGKLIQVLKSLNSLMSCTGYKIGHFHLSSDLSSSDIDITCSSGHQHLSARRALYIKVILNSD